MSRSTGIEVRHQRGCAGADGGTCKCSPTFRAWVYDRRAGKKVRKGFPTQAAAKAWRSDSVGDVRRGKLRAVQSVTLRQAAEELEAGMESGLIRNRSGDVFKPSAIRGYKQALRDHWLEDFGGRKLNDIPRQDVQRTVDELVADGKSASTVRNAVMPLRVIYRRALEDAVVSISPVERLRLPAVRGKRDRIADPAEAAKLLAALLEGDRALWASAFYAGLRLGELRALRWEDIDLASGRISVHRSWDQYAGEIAPKSRAGVRDVPIAAVLRDYLIGHKQRQGRDSGLVFGRSATRPLNPSSVNDRAEAAWKKAKLAPITLHEARHSFASLMIEAGVNAKRLSVWMGHSGIAITLDRYGHLFEKRETSEMAKLDEFLALADSASRVEQLERGPVAGQLGQPSGGLEGS